MARQTFRLNLGSAEFPFLSELYGQSVVFPQQDMHYIRPNAFSGAEADKNIGIPQLIFCENVMPTSYGYQSIGFNLAVQGKGAAVDFDHAMYLRDAGENRVLFVAGTSGNTGERYIYDAGGNAWSASSIVLDYAGGQPTVANLKQRTFVHYEFDDQFFEWTGIWNIVTLTGLTATNIKGLVSASSYLVAYDDTTIYWSSITDPTDFLPSLVTGAGSQKILQNKGRIVICRSIEDGFIIYTTANVIVARYSKNTRYPWNYTEIKDSAGVESPWHTCEQTNSTNAYYYSTNGLMVIGATKATLAFPSVDEFLGTRAIESYNSATNAVDFIKLTAKPKIKLSYVANKWLIISYGATTLTHAIIYDTSLKRWGKIRIDHVDCFEFYGNAGTAGSTAVLTWAQLPGTWAQQINTWFDYGHVISGGAASLTVPFRSLAFLASDGKVSVVDFDWGTVSDSSILILGKLQFLRDKLWQIQEIISEHVESSVDNKLAIWSCIKDESTWDSKIYPYKVVRAGRVQKWNCRITGQNHSLVFYGNFNLNTIIARGLIAGKR
jgi:hypothetical protein